MDTTELTLRWEKFGLSRGLHDMLGAGELVDVTLACQGEFLQAHKSVLAACSQQFRHIFLMNPCQHPVVFMQDVQLPHLQALLSFMYTGEATVGQSELPALLRTAQALKVSGLATATHPDKLDKLAKGATERNLQAEKQKASERSDGSQPTPSPPPPSKRARRGSDWREANQSGFNSTQNPPPPPPRASLPPQLAPAPQMGARNSTANSSPPPLLQPVDIKLEDEISLEEAGDDEDWPPDMNAEDTGDSHYGMEDAQQGNEWFDAGPSSEPGPSQQLDNSAVSSRGSKSTLDQEVSYSAAEYVMPEGATAAAMGPSYPPVLSSSQYAPGPPDPSMPPPPPPDKPWPCSYCAKFFKSSGSLANHVSLYHREENKSRRPFVSSHVARPP